MADFMKLMQQAQQVQGRLQDMQDALERQSVTGSAGGGMVTVEADGKGTVRKVKLDPSVVNPADVEGLPVAILEAMALGKPVVATAVGGVPSVVIDGETGRLVPPKDPVSLASAVAELLAKPELRHSLGTKGRDLIESRYGLARMVERYEDLYEQVLGVARR